MVETKWWWHYMRSTVNINIDCKHITASMLVHRYINIEHAALCHVPHMCTTQFHSLTAAIWSRMLWWRNKSFSDRILPNFRFWVMVRVRIFCRLNSILHFSFSCTNSSWVGAPLRPNWASMMSIVSIFFSHLWSWCNWTFKKCKW